MLSPVPGIEVVEGLEIVKRAEDAGLISFAPIVMIYLP